jgi:hypothetical protein
MSKCVRVQPTTCCFLDAEGLVPPKLLHCTSQAGFAAFRKLSENRLALLLSESFPKTG